MSWTVKPAHFSAIEQSTRVGQAPWTAIGTQLVSGKPALVMTGDVPGCWSFGPATPNQAEGSIQASNGPYHRHGMVNGIIKPVTPPTASGSWLWAHFTFLDPGGSACELHLTWIYIAPQRRHFLDLSQSYGGITNLAHIGIVDPANWNAFELQVYRDGCKCRVNDQQPVRMPVTFTGNAMYPGKAFLFFDAFGPAWAEVGMGTDES